MTSTITLGKPLQTKFCKCGHLKDEHLRDDNGDLQCQRKVFDTRANKMLQCGCKI